VLTVIQVSGQCYAGCNSGEAVSSFKNLQQLWTELKDGLALEMLAGLRQSAGLSPPLGLLALPAELKTKILASLQVLLTLIYTCQQTSAACKLCMLLWSRLRNAICWCCHSRRSLMTIVKFLANLVHTVVIGFADAG
jgi:hypothetical protein